MLTIFSFLLKKSSGLLMLLGVMSQGVFLTCWVSYCQLPEFSDKKRHRGLASSPTTFTVKSKIGFVIFSWLGFLLIRLTVNWAHCIAGLRSITCFSFRPCQISLHSENQQTWTQLLWRQVKARFVYGSAVKKILGPRISENYLELFNLKSFGLFVWFLKTYKTLFKHFQYSCLLFHTGVPLTVLTPARKNCTHWAKIPEFGLAEQVYQQPYLFFVKCGTKSTQACEQKYGFWEPIYLSSYLSSICGCWVVCVCCQILSV